MTDTLLSHPDILEDVVPTGASNHKAPSSFVQEKPLAVQAQEAYDAGAHDAEIHKILGISVSKFNELYDKDASFRKVIDQGRVASKAWWLAQARHNLTNKNFNTALWNFNMKNRYGWAEKQELTTPDTDDATLDELQARLVNLLPGTLSTLAPDVTAASWLGDVAPGDDSGESE